MVAYAMRITDLNPLDHDLIFERFLNPDRVSMPDFDVDFDDRHRGEVIDYVTEKYGEEKVAQIVTFGTIRQASAQDASRVMDQPYSVGERLTKAMPPDVMGKNIALANMYNEEDKRYAEAVQICAPSLRTRSIRSTAGFETAKGLEGLKRQWGVHAAGVIMSSKDLVDVIPVMRREADGQVITQFDYPTCEGLGLIKMDFLGLRNLTIISDAVENIKANRGIDLDLESLSLDDRNRTVCWRAAIPSACSSSMAARCARCSSSWSPRSSSTFRQCWRCTVRARWARTRTPTTLCVRTVSRRSSRSTLSWKSR